MEFHTAKDRWIDWLFFLTLISLSPVFLFPTIGKTGFYFVFPLIWLLKWKKTGKLLDKTVLDLAVFLLLFQVFIAGLIVPDLLISLPKISGVIFGIFLFYSLVAILKSESLLKIGIVIFLFSGTAISVVGVLDMNKSSKYLDLIYKVSSLIPNLNFALPGAEKGINPNPIGGTIVLVIPLFFILIFSCMRKRKLEYSLFDHKFFLIYLYVGTIITCSVLVLTLSRGSWIGLVLSVNLFLFRGIRGRKIGLLIMVCFVLAYFVLLGPIKIEKGIDQASGSVSKRIELWTLAAKKIGEKPLTGMGMNYFRQIPEVGYTMAHAHNHLIHTATELGIPGLVAYLAILIGAGYMCASVWMKTKAGWMKMTVLGLGAGQLAHFIFGIGDSIPLGAKAGIIFWMSLALITAIFNREICGKAGGNRQDPEMTITHSI
jgi:putative inorganic carbon (HCO3(-)) transporter